MGQSLFKKHSEFQKFGEILYCGISDLGTLNQVFLENIKIQKLFKKKRKYGTELF